MEVDEGPSFCLDMSSLWSPWSIHEAAGNRALGLSGDLWEHVRNVFRSPQHLDGDERDRLRKGKAKRGHSQRWRPGEAHDMDLAVCGATGFTTDVEF